MMSNQLEMDKNQLRMKDLICRSITERKLLKINYRRGPERIIEPYVYGRDSYGLKLNSYQVSGYSHSGKLSGWKLFKIELINYMVQQDQQFKVRDTYNPDYKIVNEVICKI